MLIVSAPVVVERLTVRLTFETPKVMFRPVVAVSNSMSPAFEVT